MKGGPSVEVLLDLALDYKNFISKKASDILKTQVFLYEADMERLEKAYKNGNKIAEDLLNSYAKAEFFTSLPDIPIKIDLVTFVAGVGDISMTSYLQVVMLILDLIESYMVNSMFDHNKEQQKELLALQKKNPDKRIMLVAEKGTMGVGSSRMSGVNNVALWIGKQASPYIPFNKYCPCSSFSQNGISHGLYDNIDELQEELA